MDPQEQGQGHSGCRNAHHDSCQHEHVRQRIDVQRGFKDCRITIRSMAGFAQDDGNGGAALRSKRDDKQNDGPLKNIHPDQFLDEIGLGSHGVKAKHHEHDVGNHIEMPDGEGLVELFSCLSSSRSLLSVPYNGAQITFNTQQELSQAEHDIVTFFTQPEDAKYP